MRCIGCGCTDERACTTPNGPCAWVRDAAGEIPSPPICTACASLDGGIGDDELLDDEDLLEGDGP